MRTTRRRSNQPAKDAQDADPSAARPGTSKRDAKSARRKKAGKTPVDVLLARYRRRPTVTLRNQLVERFRGTVEEMARALRTRLPRSVDEQDLAHAGMWGLMQAIDNYRVELNPSFVAFMRIRVRGAMIDELRNMDYLPRLYRARVRLRDEAVQRLRDRLDREPSDAELAEDLGVSEDRLRQLYNLRSAIPQGLIQQQYRDRDRDDAGELDLLKSLADEDQEAPFEAMNRRELMEKIESSLQPVEWDVLRLHYLEGLTGREVARKLRLSASRICQIHMRVLSRLKTRLASAN